MRILKYTFLALRVIVMSPFIVFSAILGAARGFLEYMINPWGDKWLDE